MTQYSKFNFIYHLQKWMDSVPGQTFLNYGYSWGASIVILGALFKLTHLPGANIMLYLGMGTEVIVFFLSAFDRPFDKTDDGRELPTHVTDEYLAGKEENRSTSSAVQPQYSAVSSVDVERVQQAMPSADDIAAAVVGQQSKAIADAQQQTPEMVEAQTNYVSALQNLTEMLGIAKVYEMQLKGASQQIGTIDQINEQTRKMAHQIEQLNSIYARMIEAMTVNMRVAAPGAATQQSTPESL